MIQPRKTAKFRRENLFFSISLAIGLYIFLFTAISAGAVDFPKSSGFVNDYVGLLSDSQKIALENLLRDFEKQTSNEIVVVIVSSFQGLDSFTYSQDLFMKWGIGKEEKNNGILLLIGPREGLPFPERGEIFINVGRGLEGALPDSMTGTIIRREIVPHFKAKTFDKGIINGVNAIIETVKGEYKASETDNKGINAGALISSFIWLFPVLFAYVASFLARTKSWWLGGFLGGAGGLLIGLIFAATIFGIIMPAVFFGLIGFIFDYVVSKNYAYRKIHGKPTDFWHSGGGFWRGGGGGFGGFGGGISGGGGAGGRW